jgi:hypothetical protein
VLVQIDASISDGCAAEAKRRTDGNCSTDTRKRVASKCSKAPRHEGVWRSEVRAVRSLNLGTVGDISGQLRAPGSFRWTSALQKITIRHA